jgi:imidazolonepropionase-like amidohydrolase
VLSISKIALTNVRVFDGERVGNPQTVIIDGGIIGEDATDAQEIDGKGGILLPGLIDAHVHITEEDNLQLLTRHGVTTAFDMATYSLEHLNSVRGKPGLTDILTAGISATSSDSHHVKIPNRPPGIVRNAEAAEQFIADRIADKVDYIKILADIPGPDQATLNALVRAAHRHNKIVIAHAVTYAATQMAMAAKVDFLTHTPADKAMTSADIQCMVNEKRMSIPTLTIMEMIAQRRPGARYDNIRSSVRDMHHAGVPILAGTDANNVKGVPANVPHGVSIHHELELLVDAGLTPVEALRAATVLPAKYFGLHDRGVIQPGRRADLVLIKDDPTKDIRHTRSIQRVFCGGIEYIQAE